MGRAFGPVPLRLRSVSHLLGLGGGLELSLTGRLGRAPLLKKSLLLC